MELNAKKFALAASATAGIAYTVCVAFVALFPAFSAKLASWAFHIANLQMSKVTLVSYLIGVVQMLVYFFLVGGLFGVLYNKFLAQKATSSEEYTCPMHSEVKQNSPGKCPRCGMALVKK